MDQFDKPKYIEINKLEYLDDDERKMLKTALDHGTTTPSDQTWNLVNAEAVRYFAKELNDVRALKARAEHYEHHYKGVTTKGDCLMCDDKGWSRARE